jgi:dTDP-4-dehydrorhamnose reductase
MILVTGAAGMTGHHLLDVFSEQELHRTDVTESPGIQRMDIRVLDQVMQTMARVQPELVIHLAAETDVDRCEKEPDHAFRTNYIGTLNVALACQRCGVDLVYVSTAGVFDGLKDGPYTEFDTPAPVNTYARTKLEGEKIVQTLHARHYIVRTGWLFGGRGRDKKFVGKITSLCLEGGPRAEIRAVDDKFGSPTYARDLLQAVKLISGTGYYGLYHIVNHGVGTRYDIAVEIAQILQVGARVVRASSDAFVLPAPRPRSELARNYKLELLGLDQMQHWRDALNDYLASWVDSSKTVAIAT